MFSRFDRRHRICRLHHPDFLTGLRKRIDGAEELPQQALRRKRGIYCQELRTARK